MKLFCSSFFPVSRTFSALITITKSPVSTCGVKTVFSLPRKRFAAFTATFPSTASFASISHHWRGTSVALAENVFILGKRARKLLAAQVDVNQLGTAPPAHHLQNPSWRLTQPPYNCRRLCETPVTMN